MVFRSLSGVALLLGALALAGCSQGEQNMTTTTPTVVSHQRLISQADAICLRDNHDLRYLQTQINLLVVEPLPVVRKRLPSFIHREVIIERASLSELKSLLAPVADRPKLTRFFAAESSLVEATDKFATILASTTSPSVLGAAQENLLRDKTQISTQALAYGFQICGRLH